MDQNGPEPILGLLYFCLLSSFVVIPVYSFVLQCQGGRDITVPAFLKRFMFGVTAVVTAHKRSVILVFSSNGIFLLWICHYARVVGFRKRSPKGVWGQKKVGPLHTQRGRSLNNISRSFLTQENLNSNQFTPIQFIPKFWSQFSRPPKDPNLNFSNLPFPKIFDSRKIFYNFN